MLECVLNVSEGRRPAVVAAIAAAAGADLLDLHTDGHHHRSVLTVVGEGAARAVAAAAVGAIDLRRHRGVHPRIGACDVVPFIALPGSSVTDAGAAAQRLASWLGEELGVPSFVYGEGGPSLPAVRRSAFAGLRPVAGPALPHPTAGATAVGSRRVLVAYNLWLAGAGLADARRIARLLRGPAVRALGLRVGDAAQVSLNLVEPETVGPAEAYDAVAAEARIDRAELVGLLPDSVLALTDRRRWAQLDLAPDRTIEARLGGRR